MTCAALALLRPAAGRLRAGRGAQLELLGLGSGAMREVPLVSARAQFNSSRGECVYVRDLAPASTAETLDLQRSP
jgi:hypothetical protein